MKSACCFEKGFALLAFSKHLKTKPGEAQLEFIIAMLVQVYYCYSGACKGIPFVDLFSCLFKQGFYKEISCLVIGSDFWNLSSGYYTMPSGQGQNMSFLAILKLN